MVVDFGRGSGFVAVDIGLFYGGLWVNGRVARFCTYSTTCRRPSLSLQFLTLSSVPHSRQLKPWVLPCSMWVSGLMICGFDGGGFLLW